MAVGFFLSIAALVWVQAAEPNPPSVKYFVDVRLGHEDQARELRRAGFDVAGINRAELLAGVVATEEDLARLESLGWTYQVRDKQWLGESSKGLSEYTDPQEMETFVDGIIAAHPDMVKKIVLDNTLFEGGHQYALLITKDVNAPNDRPAFLLDAQHHAREVMTAEITKDAIDYLVNRYTTDSQVKRWVDNINIYIVPIANPDGAKYVFTSDSMWRKNRHPSCSVDINRNYSILWNGCNGSSDSCYADDNRGSGPDSEPETKGMNRIMDQAHAVFGLTYHSYGEYLMYSYGCSNADEDETLSAVAMELRAKLQDDNGKTNTFKTGPIWSTIYEADGGSLDTGYGRWGTYSYVIEVNTTGFQPDYGTYRNITVQRQRTAWQFFLDKTLDGPVVRGRVTDGNGQPLAAVVTAKEITFTHGEYPRHADAHGYYHWLGKDGKTFNLRFELPGYCPEERPVSFGTGPVHLDVTLGQAGVPQGVTAAAAGDSQIQVGWKAVPDAVEYRVFRSLTSGGPFELAGTASGSATSFLDQGISGGVTWYYVVRAVVSCESMSSAEANARTSGPCTVQPSFAGLGSVQDGRSATCTVNLIWPAAEARCGGPVTYKVYRSATPGFTPGPESLVAAGLSGTAYADYGGLADHVPNYYIVRAVDSKNGREDSNLVAVSGAPTGPDILATWSDDAGDTGAAQMITRTPWSVQETGGKTQPKVYSTGSYGANSCGGLITPILKIGSGSSLNFQSKYDIDTNRDAGLVDVAQGPEFNNWVKLSTVNYPDSLTYSGNACGIATGSGKIVFSKTNSTPTYASAGYSGSMSDYAGKEVRIRFRISSDNKNNNAQGWWIDDISISNTLTPSTCSSGLKPVPKEISPRENPMTCRRSGGSEAIEIHFAPACGALDAAAFWGMGPLSGTPQWTHSQCGLGNSGFALFDPGLVAPGGLVYFVVVGQNQINEGSYGQWFDGTLWHERAEAVGIGACDRIQDLSGICP